MLNQATINRLHEMHLTAMAETYREQAGNPTGKDLSFDDWFGLMVDAEWDRPLTPSKPASQNGSK